MFSYMLYNIFIKKKTLILFVFAVGVIGLASVIANPIQLAHALNPQPLPPGIVLHFLTPPDPCTRASVCSLPSGLAEHYPHPVT